MIGQGEAVEHRADEPGGAADDGSDFCLANPLLLKDEVGGLAAVGTHVPGWAALRGVGLDVGGKPLAATPK